MELEFGVDMQIFGLTLYEKSLIFKMSSIQVQAMAKCT